MPLKRLVGLTFEERHFIVFNPNHKVATKGGSMRGIFQMQKDDAQLQNGTHSPCF
jgi:hypothetical protein